MVLKRIASMENRENRSPTGQESDISKAQAQQQPAAQAGQQPDKAEQSGQFETSQADVEQTGDQAATGQAQPGAGPDEGLQGETATQRRTDIEGASLGSEEEDEAGTGFVGSKGERDTSSELVEGEDEDFTPEGK